ncbi:MAG: prolipoprotein diacylglyceryl transferase [Pirellulales bacterium]|nr:prolipoprotein diacylglyceryl transferase [Pirellulales bacterium]
MCRTLFHIPNEIAGVGVFGVGWLLGLWVIVGIVILAWVGRKEGLGREWFGYLPLLAIVAAAIVWVLPAVCDKEGLPIRGYGTMMLVAVASGTGLFVWRMARVGVEPDLTLSMVFWMFLGGILGARAFYVIEYWSDFHKPTLGATLAAVANITLGGLVVYGSLLGGLAAMFIFLRARRLPALVVCDRLAPCLVLGLAIGRVGCLMNGCCFGGPCDHAWALRFPPDSQVYESQASGGLFHGMKLGEDAGEPTTVIEIEPDGPAARAGLRPGDRIVGVEGRPVESARDLRSALLLAYFEERPLALRTAGGRDAQMAAVPIAPRSLPVTPTQPLATINALAIMLFLLACEPFCRRDGQLFAILLTLYPITRFILEIIRTDEHAVFDTSLSISQNVSILVLVGIVVFWIFVFRQPARPFRDPSLRSG